MSDTTPEEAKESEKIDGSALMHDRGKRDGLEGLNPSSTSADYMKGYGEGRRTRIENKLRCGDL